MERLSQAFTAEAAVRHIEKDKALLLKQIASLGTKIKQHLPGKKTAFQHISRFVQRYSESYYHCPEHFIVTGLNVNTQEQLNDLKKTDEYKQLLKACAGPDVNAKVELGHLPEDQMSFAAMIDPKMPFSASPDAHLIQKSCVAPKQSIVPS